MIPNVTNDIVGDNHQLRWIQFYQHTKKCCPEIPSDVEESKDWLEDWSSGYIQRSIHKFAKQGNKKPWVNSQDYLKDWFDVKFGKMEDGSLQFSNKNS